MNARLVADLEQSLINLRATAARAIGKHDAGRVGTHDAHNMAATCGELRELAAKIELTEQLIRHAGDQS